MAFIDFTAPKTEAAPARLSGLEWSIVALAERGSLASLREPGRIATALGSLFGRSPDKRLADGRLEALRRIALLAWHHSWKVPTSELRAFVAAGFSLDQYELVQTSISRGRAARRQAVAGQRIVGQRIPGQRIAA
ncbi:MAG: hypothetical protein JWO81_1658 [Alphaproteobacteria bacterium]|nr:hypothetical protein [Alphaproteobacteria bacterium]